jgi:hypothetical protein
METRIVKNRSAPGATIVPILIYEDVSQAIECSAGCLASLSAVRLL